VKRRPQISVEFLVVVGMVLLMLSPLWFSLYRSIQEEQADLRVSQAKTALSRIVRSADLVYVQGAPASATIIVYLPAGVLNYTFAANETHYDVSLGKYVTDVVEVTKTPLTGALPISEGTHKILIRAEASGIVNITGVS
jgi:uncharacterized protein (UPF0333 family)